MMCGGMRRRPATRCDLGATRRRIHLRPPLLSWAQVRETRERRQSLEVALLPLLSNRHTLRPEPETEPLPPRMPPGSAAVVEARRTGLEHCAMRTCAKARTVVRGVRYDERAPGHQLVRLLLRPILMMSCS